MRNGKNQTKSFGEEGSEVSAQMGENEKGKTMKKRHTEGPWKNDRRGIYASENRCIAEVFSGPCNSLSEADANGLLIAAAPEILEALEWCINSRPTPSNPSNGYLKAVAAIAKALGK